MCMTLQIVHCSAVLKTWDLVIALPMICLEISAFHCFHRMKMILTYSAKHLEVYGWKIFCKSWKPFLVQPQRCQYKCMQVTLHLCSADQYPCMCIYRFWFREVEDFDHLNEVSDTFKHLAELWLKTWGNNFILLQWNIEIISSNPKFWKTHHWKY